MHGIVTDKPIMTNITTIIPGYNAIAEKSSTNAISVMVVIVVIISLMVVAFALDRLCGGVFQGADSGVPCRG